MCEIKTEFENDAGKVMTNLGKLNELESLADFINEKPSVNKRIFVVSSDKYNSFESKLSELKENGIIKTNGIYYYDEIDKYGFEILY